MKLVNSTARNLIFFSETREVNFEIHDPHFANIWPAEILAFPLLKDLIKPEKGMGLYFGMEAGMAFAYDPRILWRHTDIVNAACDPWLEGSWDPEDDRCTKPPYATIWVGREISLLPSLVPGIHFGYGWRFVRLELEYYYRTHSSQYAGSSPAARGGASGLAPDDLYNYTRPHLDEYAYTRERISDALTHHLFANIFFDMRGLPGPLVPYAGFGAGPAIARMFYSGVWLRHSDPEYLKEIGAFPGAAGTITTTWEDFEDGQWAYQWIGGLDCRLREDVHLGIKVVYVDSPRSSRPLIPMDY